MAAAVLAAAVIASAAVTALLYAAGVAGGSRTAVVAQSPHTSAGSTAAGPLDPSALVINPPGHILTASHVAGASKITVKFLNGTGRTATVLGTDTFNDASVLHVNPAGLTLHPLALGSTASLVVGDPLAVIGNPFGYNRSLSTGVVSGLERTIQAPNGSLIAHALQTDAAVNPGNSGGPPLNAQGQVVGIAD